MDSGRRSTLALLVCAGAVALYIGRDQGLLGIRGSLVLGTLLLSLAAVAAGPLRSWQIHQPVLVAVVFVASVLAQLLAPILPLVFDISGIPFPPSPPAPLGEQLREGLRSVGPMLAGWAVALSLVSLKDESSSRTAGPGRVGLAEGLCVFVAAAIFMGIAHWYSRGRFALILDEQYYLYQASALRDGLLVRPVPVSLRPFFILRQGYFTDAGLAGHYPVGWPGLLALFGVLRLTWLAPVAGSAAAVFGVYWLAARLAGRTAAVLAALLLVTNPLFVLYGATYFGDAPTAAVVVLAAAILVTVDSGGERLSAGRLLAAGLLLGTATAIKPLAGAAMSVTVLLYAWARRHTLPTLRDLILLALGTVVPGAATMLYNFALNGSALRFGYGMAQGKWIGLGMGLRGAVVYDAEGVQQVITATFSPVVALSQAVHLGADTAFAFGPLALAVPLLALAPTFVTVRSRLAILGFAALPLAHFFFKASSVRYLMPLQPFVIVAMALVLASVWRARRGRLAVLLVVAGGALALYEPVRSGGTFREVRLRQYATVEELQQRCGKVVVFVREPEIEQPLLAQLWWFNRDGFDGDIVIARDLGERNTELMRQRPQHAAFRLVSRGWWKGAPTLEPLSGEGGLARCTLN